MHTKNILEISSKFLIALSLIAFLASCGTKEPSSNSAKLSIALDLPANKSSKPGLAARELAIGEEYTFDKVIISILREDRSLIAESDILAAGGNVTFNVPPNEVLIVLGEAFADEVVEFRGETSIAEIKPGGSAKANFDLHNVTSDKVLQIDLGIAGKPIDGTSNGGVFSKNDFVIFDSNKTNLVENGFEQVSKVYLANITTGDTVSLYQSDTSNPADPYYLDADISADGQYVVFSTTEKLIQEDANDLRDVYLRNTKTNEIGLIRPIPFNQQSNISFHSPSISDDGRFIVFTEENPQNEDSDRQLVIYDRLSASYITSIGSGHNPVISGDGNTILYMKDGSNILSLYRRVENTIISLFPVLEENYPQLKYAMNFDGKTLVFAIDTKFAEFNPKQVFVLKTENFEEFTRTEASVDNNGNPFIALTDFFLSLSLDDSGRFLVFNYNTNVYVRDLDANLIQELAPGEQPFISPSGFEIGYTYNNNIFSKNNPLLEGSEKPLPKAIEPIDAEVSEITNGISVSWLAQEETSYYRVYASTLANIADRGFENSKIYETNALNSDILFQEFNLSAGSPNIYFVVVGVGPEGEYVITNEAFVEAYEPPPPPVVISEYGLFQFDFRVSALTLVEGDSVCNIDNSDDGFYEIGDLYTSETLSIVNNNDDPVITDEYGVPVNVSISEGDDWFLSLPSWNTSVFKFDASKNTHDAVLRKLVNITDGSGSIITQCELVVTAEGVRQNYVLNGSEDFSGYYVIGDKLNGENATIVSESVTITPDKLNKTIDFGLGVSQVLESHFDPLTGAFTYVADEFGYDEERGGDPQIVDFVVERLTLKGFFRSLVAGGASMELAFSSKEKIYFDSNETKLIPDLEQSGESGEIRSRRVSIRTMHRTLSVANPETDVVYDLIGIQNPPVRKIAQGNIYYLEVYQQGQTEDLCTNKNAQFVKITNKPGVTLDSATLNNMVFSYVRCLMPEGTLLAGSNYELKLFSDNGTEDPSDNVLLNEFVHTVSSVAAPETPLDINQVLVNGLKVTNGVVNGYLNNVDSLSFELPESPNADRYFVRLRDADAGVWAQSDKEVRAVSSTSQISVSTANLSDNNHLRVMTRHGLDPMALTVSDGVSLNRGANGNFTAYFDDGNGVHKLHLQLLTDTNGIVSCTGESEIYSCTGMTGSIDWNTNKIFIPLYDAGVTNPDALYPFELEFHSPEQASVIFGGDLAGTAFVSALDAGTVAFHDFTLNPLANAVELNWFQLEGAFSYSIEWSTDISELYNFGEVSSVNLAGFSSFAIDELESGTTYYIRITAEMDDGSEVLSIVRSVSTQASPIPLSFESGYSTIDVSWPAQQNAFEYAVEYSNSYANLVNGDSFFVSTSATELPILNLQSSTTYYVKVTTHYLDESASLSSAIFSVSTLEGGTLISSLVFPDQSLASCIQAQPYLYVEEVISLDCNEWGISDLSGLDGLVNLEFLDLSNNPLNSFTQLPALSAFSNLAELRLAGTGISSIPAPTGFSLIDPVFPALKRLDLSFNSVANIPDVTYFPNLTKLNLSNNLLTSIPDFSAMPALMNLDLSYNQLVELPVLTNLTALGRIDLGYNLIPTASVPQALPYNSIWKISLAGNGLTSIPNFDSIDSLTDLDISDNELASVPVFDNLTLTALYLQGNALTGNVPTYENQAGLKFFYVDAELNIPCETYILWDKRFDYRDGAGQGGMQWRECDSPATVVRGAEDFDGDGFFWPWSFETSGNFGTDGWQSTQSGAEGTFVSLRSPFVSGIGYESALVTFTHNVDTIVSFAKNIDTFADAGYLVFLIDGVEIDRWTGVDKDWLSHAYDLPAGTHTLEWRFEKVNSGSNEIDSAWIDQISINSKSADDGFEYLDQQALVYDNFQTGLISSEAWNMTTNSTMGDWSVVTDFSTNGTLVAQPAPITHGEFSSLVTQPGVFTSDGYITFDSKLSSEYGWDYLILFKNGIEILRGSGNTSWVNHIVPVAVGDEFEWRFEKDDADIDDVFSDTFWLDNVEFFAPQVFN